jgi:large repetitive protein
MSLHLFSHLRMSRAYRALAVTALLGGAACALSASPAGAQPATTSITTALYDGTNVGPNLTDPPGSSVSDTANFANGTGAGAMGSVTYSVYSDSACTVPVGSPDTENISPSTPGVLPPSGTVTINTPGTYYLVASYSGDTNNAGSQTACGSETLTIQSSGSSTGMSTKLKNYQIQEGGSDTESAVVTGSASGPAPTGTVTFSLCGPLANEIPPVPCTALTDESSGPIPLTPGGGSASKAVSPSFTPTSPGWWCFEDSYSGDSNYYSSSDYAGKGACIDVIPLPGAVDYAGVALVTNGNGSDRSTGTPDQPTTYSAATSFTVPSVSCGDATSGMIDGTGVFSSVSNWVSAGGVVVECSGGVLTYSSQAIINNVMTPLTLTPAPGDTVSTDVEVTSTGGSGGNTSVTVDDPTQNYSNTTTASGGMVGTYMSVGIDALRDYTTGDAYPPPSFGGLNFSNSSIDGKSLEASGATSISRVSASGQLEIYTGPIDASGDGFGQLSEPAGTYAPGMTAAPAVSSVPEDSTNTVTATVTGNDSSGSPTGNVSFTECGPLPSPKACSASADPLGSSVGVSAGSGDTASATSAPLTPDAPGYWCIQSTYTGDANYGVASDKTTDGCFKVTAVPLSITTTSLPDATIGVPYSATLQATGGTPPFKWKVVTGTLPAGLTLTKSSGTISGTPSSSATTSTFQVKVKDSSATAEKSKKTFTITVS